MTYTATVSRVRTVQPKNGPTSPVTLKICTGPMDGGPDCCWNCTAIGLAPCRRSWVVAVGVGVCMRLSGAVGFRGLLNIRQRTWTTMLQPSGGRVWALMPAAASRGGLLVWSLLFAIFRVKTLIKYPEWFDINQLHSGVVLSLLQH